MTPFYSIEVAYVDVRTKYRFRGRMKTVHFLPILLVSLCGFAHSDTVITVFGLPLGGRLSYDIKICPPSMTASSMVCWEDKKPDGDNGLAGTIQMPSPDKLPMWAVSGSFFLWLARDGALNELTVEEASSDSLTIQESISRRFGGPTSTLTVPSSRGGSTYYATWERQDIKIQMHCGTACHIRFVSSRLANERAEIFRQIDNTNAARPFSP